MPGDIEADTYFPVTADRRVQEAQKTRWQTALRNKKIFLIAFFASYVFPTGTFPKWQASIVQLTHNFLQIRWLRIRLPTRRPRRIIHNDKICSELPFSRKLLQCPGLVDFSLAARRYRRVFVSGRTGRDLFSKVHHVHGMLLGDPGKLSVLRCACRRSGSSLCW